MNISQGSKALMTSIGRFSLVDVEIYDEMKRRIQNPTSKRVPPLYERWTEDKDLYAVQNENLVVKSSNQSGCVKVSG